MEHWSNINSAYGRLSSASGVTPSASSLSPFDLHVMDQRSFGNSGLTSGLTNPLPAHATPLTPARITNMSHPVNYGTLHSSMTPLFDAFGSSGFSNQTSYRPAGQALYSLESVGSHADTMSRLASVISSQPARSSSLFGADLHAMNESPIQGLASSVEPSDLWQRSGFAAPAGGPASFTSMPSSSGSGGAKKDPPPAHSGSRLPPSSPAKTRFCRELPSVTQQGVKNEFAPRASVAHPSSLAASPPTAHGNSQRFEAQSLYDGHSSQPLAAASDQPYVESALHIDLNEVIPGDNGSGSLVGHSPFGGCSPTAFSSTGFSVAQKTRTQAVFQPAAGLSSPPSCLSESRLHGAVYGLLAADSNAVSASRAEFGSRKDFAGGTNLRTVGCDDDECRRSVKESFALNILLDSTAAQSSISNSLTVQAVADSTTKPKKPAARAGRAARTGRAGRAVGQGFDDEYPDDSLLDESVNVSDGRRGQGAKSRRASENKDLGQNNAVFENVGRYVPQLVGSPSGGSCLAPFAQAVVPEGHLLGNPLQSESYAYSSAIGSAKQENDTQLFLTNLSGISFVNPNELLVKPNAAENYAVGNEALSYDDSVNYEDATKLNEAAVVDEEFAHLTEEPKSGDSKNQTGTNCTKSEAKSPATKGNFLASFVNFISGKKPETLSSVSNINVCSRPVLPKYVPDPWPRKKEEKVAKIATSDSSEKSKTGLTNSAEEIKTSESKKPDGVASSFAYEAASVLNSTGPTPKSKDKIRRPVLKSKDLSEIKVDQASVGTTDARPARPQPTRRAKTAVEEKRRRLKDSDDSSDEEVKRKGQSRSRRGGNDDDYDSDKDPAWKPERETFPVSRKRTNYIHDDEYITPSKRNRNKRYSAKSDSSNEVVSLASPSAAPVSVKTTSLPETKSSVASSQSPSTGSQLVSDTQDLYQKGNFVIEKKNLKNLPSSFSIWKIDSGRLLQKFEPIMRDGKLMHQAMFTYSSWSDDIKDSYSAIKVTVIVASRSQEIVEVVRTDLESSVVSYEALLEPFNIFIQILLSQSLEPNFLDALLQDPDPYYMDPLGKIEAAIESSLNQLRKTSKWTKEFLDVADKMSNFSWLETMTDSTYCQATEGYEVPAVVSVRFSGPAYDSLTLKSLEEAESCKEFSVGEWTRQHLPTYHGLRHLKFTFYQKCKAKVDELKNGSDIEDHQLLDLCLQNLTWMKELFTTFEFLLTEVDKKCN